MNVFVHDQKEKFTTLKSFTAEKLSLLNDTVTSIFIRPEMIQKLSKHEDPCIIDEGYSYTRVSCNAKNS